MPDFSDLDWYREFFARWGLSRLFSVLLVLVLTYVLLRAIRHGCQRMKDLAREKYPDDRQAELRAITLSTVLRDVGRTVVLVLGGMQVLTEAGFNITPIIASAGIAGIAVGFGAQSLVRDVISGFFILLENLYGVGDVVTVEGRTGTVEQMKLRLTVLRDLEGAVHYIPNGEIKTVTVHTKGWAQSVVDVEVAYEEDVDRAMAILGEVCQSVAQDWPDSVSDKPSVLGVQRLAVGGYTLRAVLKTPPLKNFDVTREVRRRVLNEFPKQGIRIGLTSSPLQPDRR